MPNYVRFHLHLHVCSASQGQDTNVRKYLMTRNTLTKERKQTYLNDYISMFRLYIWVNKS